MKLDPSEMNTHTFAYIILLSVVVGCSHSSELERRLETAEKVERYQAAQTERLQRQADELDRACRRP